MKQAIIYTRGIERGALQEQLAVCRMYAARCGYRIVRIIFQTGSFPAIKRIACFPGENVIVASPSVLGSPAWFLSRRTKFNLAGKRVLIATKEDVI